MLFRSQTDRGVYYPGDQVTLRFCLSIKDKDFECGDEYEWAGPDSINTGENTTFKDHNAAPLSITITFENNDGTIVKSTSSPTQKGRPGNCWDTVAELNAEGVQSFGVENDNSQVFRLFGIGDECDKRTTSKWSQFEYKFSIPNNSDAIGKWSCQAEFGTGNYEAKNAVGTNCDPQNRPDDWTGNMDTAFYVVASSDCLGAEEVKKAEGDVVSTMSNIDFLNSYMAF